MTNTSLDSLVKPLKQAFGKYHATLFFALIGLLLAGAIYMLYGIIQIPAATDDTATTSDGVRATFSPDEKETIKKIEQLRESSEATANLDFPSPRSNPFIE